MVKKFGGVYLFCVNITERNDYATKNKPVFHINSVSSTYYCVKGILHPIIINNTSLITATLFC